MEAYATLLEAVMTVKLKQKPHHRQVK